MSAAYHWLVANGLWHFVIGWIVAYTLTRLAGVRRAWRKHQATQEQIADRLDADTPGGLGDVMVEAKRLRNDRTRNHSRRF